MSILNNDINRLEQFPSTELRQIIRVVATVGGITAVLLTVSPPLALVVFFPVPLIGLGSMKFLTWIEPKYKRIRESVVRLNSRLEKNFGGAKVSKAFDCYEFERGRVAGESKAYHDRQVEAIKLRRGFFAAIRLFTGPAFVGILVIGGKMIVAGSFDLGQVVLPSAISAGTFTMFFLCLQRMYSPMRRIGRTANRFRETESGRYRSRHLEDGYDRSVTTGRAGAVRPPVLSFGHIY